jgi:hypothetical protein
MYGAQTGTTMTTSQQHAGTLARTKQMGSNTTFSTTYSVASSVQGEAAGEVDTSGVPGQNVLSSMGPDQKCIGKTVDGAVTASHICSCTACMLMQVAWHHLQG